MILKIIAYGFLILAFVLSVIALCGMCKVASDSDDQMERIFRMIDAWKAEKEINVGDEVRLKRDPGDEYKFFVTDKDGFEISGFSGFKGSVFSCRDIRLYEKTGRHIDIEGILKQIGGDE